MLYKIKLACRWCAVLVLTVCMLSTAVAVEDKEPSADKESSIEHSSIKFEFLSDSNLESMDPAAQSVQADSPGAAGREYRILRNGVALPLTVRQDNRVALGSGFDPLADPQQNALRTPSFDTNIEQFAVQFHTQLIPAYRQLLSDNGLEILGTQSKQVLLVRGSGMQANSIAADPRVRWVGQVLATDKIDFDYEATVPVAQPSALTRDLSGSSGPTKFNVRLATLAASEKAELQRVVLERGGKLLDQHTSSRLAVIELDYAQLLVLAASPAVEQIEFWSAPEPDMNNVRALTGSDYAEVQPPILVPGLTAFTGNGVRGEVMDAPWVRATHNGFNPAPIPHSVGGTAASGHATSVYGIVFGDGTGNANARGQIPDGTGIYSSYGDISNPERAAHTAELVSDFRAVFQTNSWGNARTFNYTTTSRDFDQVLFDNDVLILQSQSNAGNQDSRPQAWAKNALAIGGVRHIDNQNLGDDYWCTSGHATTCAYNGAASIGPADDGRLKPDVANAYDSTLTTDADSDSDYRFNFGGTSGATPITAGTAGIMFQMWAEGVLTGTPSPAGSPDTYVFANRPKVSTAKALLINTARQYPISAGGGQNIPRNIQGWGVPNAEDLFVAAHNHGGALPLVVDEDTAIETGQVHNYTITVADLVSNPIDRWMKVTMVYKDPPAAGNPILELVNDLTLRATSPGGTVYWGNVGVNSANWSSSGGSADTINNVENVFIQSSEAGVWQIDVLGTDIGTDAHSDPTDAINAVYSLVVSCGGSNLCTDTTLPVSLSNFTSSRSRNRLGFDWMTSTESFNIGFNLWGEIDGEWIQLNRNTIASKRGNAMQAQSYRHRVRLNDQLQGLARVGISSVDISGREEFYGPFEIGEEYGQGFVPDAIDWQAVRNEHHAKMLANGFKLVKNRWRKVRKNHKRDRGTVAVEINQQGIYRISYEDLLAAGADWRKIGINNIALAYQGQAIPRYIAAMPRKRGKRQKFGPGGYIEFHAMPPQGKDALYTESAVYTLSIAPEQVVVSGIVEADDGLLADWVYRDFRVGENASYAVTSPGNDPWVDATLISIDQPGRKDYHFFDLPAAVPNQQAYLQVNLSGGLNLPGHPFDAPDHHVRVYLNGVEEPVIDAWQDGVVDWPLKVALDSNSLRAGANTVTVEVVGDTGYFADIVIVDEVSLSVPTAAISTGERLLYKTTDQSSGIRISGYDSQSAVAYAFTDDHDLARLQTVPVKTGSPHAALAVPVVADPDARYWLSTAEQVLRPDSIRMQGSLPELGQLSANYLVIAHPQFNTERLQDYVAHRQAQGFAVEIVDVFDIYDTYSDGMPLPSSISAFIKAQADNNPLTHVLLVGGNSYDYHDYLGLGSVSFMPTFYAQSSIGFFTPSDTPYADLNDDEIPDIAIGRWPVRSVAELEVIIDKTLAWEQSGYPGEDQSALLIAENSEADSFVSFQGQVEEISKYLIDADTIPWGKVEKLYLQSDTSMSEARQTVIDTINRGVTLTVFDGHASAGQWGRSNIFNQQDAKLFEDNNRATQVLSLACYTTYFDSPSSQTLAQQMLLANRGGAVAINGSISLGRYKDNELLGVHITHNQLAEGMDIGTAIMRAKQRVGISKRDAIKQWTLLGDPTLRIGNGTGVLPGPASAPAGN